MMMDTDKQRDLIAYLDFHEEAGVDIALDERPHDRFSGPDAAVAPEVKPVARLAARPPIERGEPEKPATRTPTYGGSAAAPPDAAAGSARAQASEAKSLEELEALLRAFDGCPLRFTAKNLAFSDGDPAAPVMFIGEAPGADEDRVGKPFMGRSGQLLDRMMATIGLDRTGAYIANIVPWRPPGNRTPTPQEAAICRPFLERQIALVDPKLIVCLGSPATQALTGTKDGILKMRGRFHKAQVAGREFRVLATLHPAYLLRQPLQKRLAWRDFRLLRAALDGAA
ncbi:MULTISPECIES: uracil-DNA glycosylase [Methylobacterium]|uniref:Type-4 uracil-DNA glycosylase n=1 Tax=Methylobacterium jeotgali TaxID=381630 RepID=A0ABQ4SWU6_9HYPH|nr:MULTISPECIES: uracil-DNA glycosylase [Methylobacterium]PIU08251.1 MAG: uracil-DNA glycosylase [Methylobacterium sp. CG09_land_8_20_14_0_10_71_15]PIU12896.1 MAG: uracil-DNA glycosylase [Methylobacterium sp. CG08_land_8_20_14_0_20_71_15]GBU17509.1 uracil-DNA glycosylase [Methylobacterium sp.]GJE06156.1 hypothetical protein AOPFMNJM_1469 [Methylobacterium jeotgali]